MNAREQILAVLRYHRHTLLQGRALTLEQAACEWIRRYASLWREHLDRRQSARS